MTRQRKTPGARRAGGFSVVETILVIAISGVLGTLMLNFLGSWLPRIELRGAVRQVQFLISKARLEAIQRGVVTVVETDLEAGTLRAWADVNGDPMAGSPGHASYLKYDPEPALGEKQTDYEIAYLQLERSAFGAPASYARVEGFVAVPGAAAGTPAVLVFSPGGVAAATGALRLTDRQHRNFLEAAVTSLAGKVEVRKYLPAEDSPTSSAGFFREARGRDGSVWIWY